MNRTTMKTAAATAVLTLAVPATAAVTLFEQAPALVDGTAADASGFNPTRRTADNFSLAGGGQIQTVQWWGFYLPLDLGNPTSLDDFTVTFYTNEGGLPGAVAYQENLFATAEATGEFVAGVADQYLYTADLSQAFEALADETYFFSVTNNTGLGDEGTWGWEFSSLVDGVGLSPDGGNFWQADGSYDVAFRLVGVPGPATGALLALAGLAGSRRRK
jgi:hypothetical protein